MVMKDGGEDADVSLARFDLAEASSVKTRLAIDADRGNAIGVDNLCKQNADPAQALAVMTAMKLKNASPPTSQRSIPRPGNATVTPIRSK